MAGLRLGAAGVAGAGRAAEHDHGPRQGPFDLHRLAQQGRLWPPDSPQVAGPDLSTAEVAAPHPNVEERGALPRPGPHRDQHDGLEDGLAPPRAGERRGPVPAGVDQEPRPGTVDRRGRRRDLYASCRQSGVPRTLDEIASKSSVDRKSIGRTYRTLV